jgi:hypothetical protein
LNESSSRALTGRNVSRAIARSRAVRSTVARRRRRAVALAASLAAVVGLPIAWIMAEPATAVATAVASEARDLADLLSQRSPGTRTQAELTKHARVASKIRTPPRAATPAGRPILPGVPATADLVDLLQPPIAPVGIVSEGLQPPLAPPATLGAILASAPGDQAFTPPGGGGGGGTAHYPTIQPREELPQTSAVPEPGTWALMLTGFGLIAWRLRRRRPFAATARRAAR